MGNKISEGSDVELTLKDGTAVAGLFLKELKKYGKSFYLLITGDIRTEGWYTQGDIMSVRVCA